jgi:uncharacterized membrane protein YuzA (DUF378 family)
MQKRKLPNATAVLILGIFSILTCCCYGVVGLALGIVALVLAKKDIALYKADPELYSDYSNLNTGRILAIIGIVLSAIYLLITLFSFVFYGSEAMQQMQNDMIKKIEQRQ